MTRMDAEANRPIDDPAPIRNFPKYGRPLVYVSGIYGKAVGWTHTYGLIEWLNSSGKYHMGWGALIKHQAPATRRMEGQQCSVGVSLSGDIHQIRAC